MSRRRNGKRASIRACVADRGDGAVDAGDSALFGGRELRRGGCSAAPPRCRRRLLSRRRGAVDPEVEERPARPRGGSLSRAADARSATCRPRTAGCRRSRRRPPANSGSALLAVPPFSALWNSLPSLDRDLRRSVAGDAVAEGGRPCRSRCTTLTGTSRLPRGRDTHVPSGFVRHERSATCRLDSRSSPWSYRCQVAGSSWRVPPVARPSDHRGTSPRSAPWWSCRANPRRLASPRFSTICV